VNDDHVSASIGPAHTVLVICCECNGCILTTDLIQVYVYVNTRW